ncbi:uncharacterized protein LOC127279736 [Leptopilina boulardi]|uniref:uncharacterized protein LOC127279736 n=1 Tax=Leptopilina boulardi TaxID=63433 RepID=UPI0021F5E735|nr:uncharacterized protein LOC127279736 [Leptopilina boulardi]
MKNKTKKRNIDEVVGDEELKNLNESGHKKKQMKKQHSSNVHLNKNVKSNLTKISPTDNTSVFEKSKKKKNLNNSEKLNVEQSSVISGEDDINVNENNINEEMKGKSKDSKAKEAKREKRKQSRKEHGQYKVSDTVSIDVLKQKIAEIESRENISKTAKRKLRVFKKKLSIAQETPSSSSSEIPKLTKAQKKKLKQEKSNLETTNESQLEHKESIEKNNMKKKIETTVESKNVKTQINDAKSLNKPLKSENKKTLKTVQNSKMLIENEVDSSEENNSDSKNVENESEDDSSEESSQLMEEEENVEMNDSNATDEENDNSEEDEQEMKELEIETTNDTENDIKKSIQKPTKPKQQKNQNVKKMSNQENTEKKKRYVLFVGNIPFQATVEDIKKHFLQKVNEVISVRIPTIKGSKKPRGFAYVEVTNSVDYEKALSLHHTNIQGFKIKVEYTQTGSKNIKNKQEVVAKNQKLHALRKAGKLAGSKKLKNQRNFRRKLKNSHSSEIKDKTN